MFGVNLSRFVRLSVHAANYVRGKEHPSLAGTQGTHMLKKEKLLPLKSYFRITPHEVLMSLVESRVDD